MPALFAATLFLSATLLFMVQPMVGKMILPLLGGSPAAWNTCMVFFQGLLLLGYFYSHKITGDMPPKRQAKVHVTVLIVTCGLLILAGLLSPNNSPVPVFRSLAPQGVAYPMFGVLALLMVAIGLPFLVVSTSAPLLQRWFNYTGHPSSKDPYFLYAASNAGSLISLLGYPIFVEPQFTLVQQAWIWAFGFLILTGMVFLCGKLASVPIEQPKRSKHAAPIEPTASPFADRPDPTGWDKLRWVGYAFVPSSLMLGVTFHMTTDIASVPLLWVIPLALYLLTFIIAFARMPEWFKPFIGNLSPVMTLLLVFVLVSGVTSLGGFTAFMALGIHLMVYFTTALLMHTQLAQERPAPKHLTNYFIWISVGGVLGGIFNALVAPMVFPQAYEYPIAIAIGCLLIPALDSEMRAARSDNRKRIALALDVLIPLCMAGLVVWLTWLANTNPDWMVNTCDWIAQKVTVGMGYLRLESSITWNTIRLLFVYALPCVLCFLFIDRPTRFGLCVAVLLGVCYYRIAEGEATEAGARSFFGILRVEKATATPNSDLAGPPLFVYLPDEPILEANGALGSGLVHYTISSNLRRNAVSISGFQMHKLLHGTTLHGMQAVEGHVMAHLLTDPDLVNLDGRATTRELAFETLTRDYIRLLGSSHGWDALFLGALPTAWDFRQEPLTYYHRTGPVGEIFRRLRQVNPLGDIGMVGLGTGSVACYALPGQRLTFYEIDTAVIKLVEDGKYFTFVKAARERGATVDFVLGDARLQLEDDKDRKYAALLIDAFSSDSIPVHLLTRESIELYKERLAPGGLLALHISNRYVMLEPVVARLAQDANLVARVFNDNSEGYPGKTASSWVVLAKKEEDLGHELLGGNFDERYGAVAGGFGYIITDNPGSVLNLYTCPWRKPIVDPVVEAWRDDYADVLRVMRLEEIRTIRRLFGLPVPGDSE